MLLKGLLLTVELTFIVIVLALLLGIPVAIGRLSRYRLLRVVLHAYVELFRATPLLVQLVFIYFALPSLGLTLDAFYAAVIGFTLHYTAYISEVYRAGILGVPRGQIMAVRALGMKPLTAYRVVILPQAIRLVIPALGNYWVQLFKDSSLASVITLRELLFSGEIIASHTFEYFTMYAAVFVLYFCVGYPATWGVRFLERLARPKKARRPVGEIEVPTNAAATE
ncbi:MAG: amino acid ABC transporter permease [Candidimonas sp.]|nr:MAG: amino acid ABC transporter permease [Candidimonas sp.]